MPHADESAPISPRLTDAQVRERLSICNSPEIVDELYTYGHTLTGELLSEYGPLNLRRYPSQPMGPQLSRF